MFEYFSWEKDDKKLPMYMPQAKLSLLGPREIGGYEQSKRFGLSPKQIQNNIQIPSFAKPTPQTGGGGSRKKPSQEEKDPLTRPSETWQPDYNSHDTSNTLDPLNPNNYEWNEGTGQFESKILDPFDPGNYEWDPATNAPKYIGDSVWNPDHFQGTLYDPSNPFDLTEDEWVKLMGAINSGSLLEEGLGLMKNSGLLGGLSDMGGVADEIVQQGMAGGLMDSLGGIYDKFSNMVPWLSAAKLGYDLFTGDADTAHKVQQGITQGVPTILSMIPASGPAAPLTAAMYGALAAAQAIGANQNKPSRDYFDPYYQADLGDGLQFLLGASRGEQQSQITPEQSWTQVLDQLAGGSKNAAFIKDASGQLYTIPMDVMFDQGWQRPLTDEEQFLETAGMGGYTPDQTSTRDWLAQTYNPEDINQRILDYYQSGDAERVGFGMFKDTPVIANSGKDPLTYESVIAGFDASQPFFGTEYGSYDTEWRSPSEQAEYDMMAPMGEEINSDLLDFLAI